MATWAIVPALAFDIYVNVVGSVDPGAFLAVGGVQKEEEDLDKE